MVFIFHILNEVEPCIFPILSYRLTLLGTSLPNLYREIFSSSSGAVYSILTNGLFLNKIRSQDYVKNILQPFLLDLQ